MFLKMSHKLPRNGAWIKQFPEPIQKQLIEKVDYGNKLTDLIEAGRTAALGLDFESKHELLRVERQAIKHLRKTHEEIKAIIFSEQKVMTNAVR